MSPTQTGIAADWTNEATTIAMDINNDWATYSTWIVRRETQGNSAWKSSIEVSEGDYIEARVLSSQPCRQIELESSDFIFIEKRKMSVNG